MSVASVADGVVFGSQIITALANLPEKQRSKAVEDNGADVCGRRITDGFSRKTEHNSATQIADRCYVSGAPNEIILYTPVQWKAFHCQRRKIVRHHAWKQ